MTDERPTVLLVDDTPENLVLLGELLRETYRVKVANNGERALALAATGTPPDLIVLDIMMPGIDGYEVCARLKADPTLRDIPVIFVSGLTETLDKVHAFEVGGVDFVTKPFQSAEVHARVGTHLRLRRMRQELEVQHHELQASYARLQELERMREGLTQMIVHDLRQPLTGLLGYLEMMGMAPKDPAAAGRYLARARHNADTLLKMINNLIDMAKLEEGKYTVRRQAVNPRALADEAVSTVASLNPRCRVEIVAELAPELCDCDPELIRRVLTNLVTNAVQFTRDGSVVRVSIEGGLQAVTFAVADQGPGVPAEFRLRIFEKFGALAVPRENRRLSAGLGLAFCKLAVEAHGGRIGVDSEEGVGSTFHVELPASSGGA